jgi:hypothetical protein
VSHQSPKKAKTNKKNPKAKTKREREKKNPKQTNKHG